MFPLWDAAAQHFSKVKRLLVAGYYSVFPSKNRQILRRIARISGCYKPQWFTPTAGPSEARVFWMTIFRRRGHASGFHLGTDQVGQRVAHLFGDRVQLSACLGFMTVLIAENRLGEVLLQLPQLFERQCLEIEFSHACLVSRMIDPG